jgi:hypothetical protein
MTIKLLNNPNVHKNECAIAAPLNCLEDKVTLKQGFADILPHMLQ